MSTIINHTEFDVRAKALKEAVRHHSAAALSDKSMPASSETVLRTAFTFEQYLKTGQTDTQRR